MESFQKSAEEFYDALQTKTTGAFCKLEVLDTNGELRLAQTALYLWWTSRIRYCIR